MLVPLNVSLNIIVHNSFIPIPEDQTTGLEKIIRFGQVYQQKTNMSATNTLFGDLPLASRNKNSYSSAMRSMAVDRFSLIMKKK
jgi:hypothetical protein